MHLFMIFITYICLSYTAFLLILLISSAFVCFSLRLLLLHFTFHGFAGSFCMYYTNVWQGVIIGYKSTHKLSLDNLRLYLTLYLTRCCTLYEVIWWYVYVDILIYSAIKDKTQLFVNSMYLQSGKFVDIFSRLLILLLQSI